VPVAQAPAPRGDDPDDSGDGGDDDDDDAEEEENNDEDANDEQEDNFVGMWPVAEHYTSMFETGHFPNLLQDVLHALGTCVRPLYDTRRVSEPLGLVTTSLMCISEFWMQEIEALGLYHLMSL
jgi:hypothetical protein